LGPDFSSDLFESEVHPRKKSGAQGSRPSRRWAKPLFVRAVLALRPAAGAALRVLAAAATARYSLLVGVGVLLSCFLKQTPVHRFPRGSKASPPGDQLGPWVS
jgi:hypothetical protein